MVSAFLCNYITKIVRSYEKTVMRIFAPKYYGDFKCIADKCNHSCCIGWEIDVDGETLEKYQGLKAKYASEIVNSIEYSETPHFKLMSGDRCPHLNECGLCRIILEVGEEYLCNICREHPRFYNDIGSGKAVGLGLSCEEAARIILSSDDYAELVVVDELSGEAADVELDALPYIEKIYSVLANASLTYNEKLSRIYKMGGYSYPITDDERIRDILFSLEYLNEENRELFSSYESVTVSIANVEKMLERALAYFVFRHLPKASDTEELWAYLGFCLICERLIAFLAYKKGASELEDFLDVARVVSEELEYSEDNTYAIASEFI